MKGKGKRTYRSKKTIAKAVKHEIVAYEKKNMEMKFYPASVGVQFFYGGTAGTIFQHLTGVAQQITDSDRVGDRIRLHSVEFEMVLFNGGGATANTYNDTRVIIFQYNAPDMSPTAAQMFITNNILGVGAVNNAYSARNIDYLQVCHSLVDKCYHTEQGVPNALNYAQTGNFTKHIKIKVPLKYAKKTISFQAASTNTNNGLWACIIGSSGSVATNPFFGMKWELHYTDA